MVGSGYKAGEVCDKLAKIGSLGRECTVPKMKNGDALLPILSI